MKCGTKLDRRNALGFLAVSVTELADTSLCVVADCPLSCSNGMCIGENPNTADSSLHKLWGFQEPISTRYWCDK